MKKTINILFRFLYCITTCRWKLIPKKVFLHKPSMMYMSKSSKIIVHNKLYVNHQAYHREFQNKLVGQLYLYDDSTLKVDRFTFFAGCRVTVNKGAMLKLGTGYMNYNGIIECYDSITIGNNVIIGENVYIIDSDNHDIVRPDYKRTLPICIDDGVWIGTNSTILKGVHLGKNTIVAAGSLVTKSTPPNSLVAGIPARVIKENVIYKRN